MQEIIEQLIKADLVIADISGANPNVYYELGIRHSVGKPAIVLLNQAENSPFDLVHTRHISYRLSRSVDRVARQTLDDRVKHMIDKPEKMDGPVALLSDIKFLSISAKDKT